MILLKIMLLIFILIILIIFIIIQLFLIFYFKVIIGGSLRPIFIRSYIFFFKSKAFIKFDYYGQLLKFISFYNIFY